MSDAQEADALIVQQIRDGDPRAWEALVDRYEGRLLAFAESRLGDPASAEDVVQEALIGFLTSLPNYDGARPLESYLFSICAYKLTDLLRRNGRRPAIRFDALQESRGSWEPAAPYRGASSMARSGERKAIEEEAIRDAIAEQIARWKERGDWVKLQCLELLFVRGVGNKEVAAELGLSEQQVANYKSDFQIRLRAILTRMQLSEDLFPELYE